MLSAIRGLIQRDDVMVDTSYLDGGFDVDGIFAPEGVDYDGDAGALAIAAFFAGVRLRAGLISSLPLRWEIDGRPQEMLPPILERPDPTEDVTVTIKRLVASLAMRGNGIGVLGGFDELGFANTMKVVHPAGVQAVERAPDQDQTGGLYYRIAGVEYRWDEILHTRGMTLPGALMAVSPIEATRRTLKGARQVEEYGRSWFTRSGVPSAVVKVNRPRKDLDTGELKLLKAKWMQMLANGREPVFVPEDISIEKLTISNEDSQFLGTRELSITDIANIVGVPGYFIGARGSSRTYTNMQDERRALLDIYLREDIEAIEDAFSALLPVGRAKFDPASFLRLDQKATAEALAIEAMWLTVDEIREIVGRKPLPNGAGQVLARPETLPD